MPSLKAVSDTPIVPNPPIKTEEDLETLPYPDFYTSGLMPHVLEVHNTAEKLLKGRIPVFFERWDRGPWGIAIQLRGFTELIKDTLRRPEFVHKLLTFITEARMRWEREKERYLGTKAWQGSLADDEVTADLLSPRIYRTFAYPYERKLAEFYPNGIFYFHSCGDLTPFLDTIKTIPGVRRILISPHTDFNTAVNTFGNTVIYQKRMHPIDDVLRCPPTLMEHKLKNVLEIGKGQHLELDPGPIVEASTNTISEWINITRRLTRTRVCQAS